jgi:hypothetical protein
LCPAPLHLVQAPPPEVSGRRQCWPPKLLVAGEVLLWAFFIFTRRMRRHLEDPVPGTFLLSPLDLAAGLEHPPPPPSSSSGRRLDLLRRSAPPCLPVAVCFTSPR